MRSLRRWSCFSTCAHAALTLSCIVTIVLYPQPLVARTARHSAVNLIVWCRISASVLLRRFRIGHSPFVIGDYQSPPAPPPPNPPPPKPPNPPPPPPPKPPPPNPPPKPGPNGPPERNPPPMNNSGQNPN